MPSADRPDPPLIGPNAVLQLADVLRERCGAAALSEVMIAAALDALPDGRAMIPEADALAMHRAVRARYGAGAPPLLDEAGRRTAAYIIAHRIPRAASLILRLLPARPAAALLSRAIARHAWTFAGSAAFRATDPFTFEFAHSRFDDSTWHAAVFAELYDRLVARGTTCSVQGADPVRRFVISFHAARPVTPDGESARA